MENKIIESSAIIAKLKEQMDVLSNKFEMYSSSSYSKSKIIKTIDSIDLSHSTKLYYKQVWNCYETWCYNNERNPANEKDCDYFLYTLNKNSKTKRKYRNALQSIFRNILEKNILLKRIYKKEPEKSNYFWKNSKLKIFLKNRKKLMKKIFLIFYMLAKIAVRIHALSNLKLKHLTFFSRNNKSLIIPTTKTKSMIIDPDNVMKKYLAYIVKKKTFQI